MPRGRIEFRLNAEEQKIILDLIGLARIQEVGQNLAIKEFLLKLTNLPQATTTPKDLDHEYKILRNENLRLKNRQINLDFKLKLIREAHYTPSDAQEIVEGRKKLEDATITLDGVPNLTTQQWDDVYGALLQPIESSDGTKLNQCIICRCAFEKMHSARNDIIMNHPKELKQTIALMLK